LAEVIISAKEVMFLPLGVLSVCQQNISNSCQRILMKLIGGVECVTGNSWLNFGHDLDHDAYTDILVEFLPGDKWRFGLSEYV